ncbi:hypothetical protein PVK06_026656 [Gossypium arboreum]|uniref:Uncharacterized protein n=1 Tax=Gossypium arboreum TaxID=29729 RepID=A0ABR0NYT4_GOSAR|nr:hypothetical protein PVK06_026656 [Gossypium arboreum]
MQHQSHASTSSAGYSTSSSFLDATEITTGLLWKTSISSTGGTIIGSLVSALSSKTIVKRLVMHKSACCSLCTVHFQSTRKHVNSALKKAGLDVSSSSNLVPTFHVIMANPSQKKSCP